MYLNIPTTLVTFNISFLNHLLIVSIRCPVFFSVINTCTDKTCQHFNCLALFIYVYSHSYQSRLTTYCDNLLQAIIFFKLVLFNLFQYWTLLLESGATQSQLLQLPEREDTVQMRQAVMLLLSLHDGAGMQQLLLMI